MVRKLNRPLNVFLWGFILLLFGQAQGAADLRNPFTFPPGVLKGGGLMNKEGIVPEKEGKEAIPVFRVTTILVSGQTKVAAINGLLLRKGEELSGFRIVEIEERQVTLSRGKEKLVLKFDQGERMLPKKIEAKK